MAQELAEPPAWINTLYFDSRAISTDEARTVALGIFSFHSPSSESKSSSYSCQHGRENKTTYLFVEEDLFCTCYSF